MYSMTDSVGVACTSLYNHNCTKTDSCGGGQNKNFTLSSDGWLQLKPSCMGHYLSLTVGFGWP